MQLYNSSESILEDLRRGIIAAVPELKSVSNTLGFIDRNFDDSHIPIISGSGSGHDPSDWGFVGKGMLAASISGGFFDPPTVEEIIKVTKKTTKKKRVFYIIKNFSKDIQNFEQAIKQLRLEKWQVEYCIVGDDVSVDYKSLKKYRRGLAGTIFVEKILGFYSKKGYGLSELKEIATRVLQGLCTIGIAFNDSKLSKNVSSDLKLHKNEIYYGIGIHGEPGYRKEKWHPSELMAREIINKFRINLCFNANDNYAILINGLGKITKMEELIFFADISELLKIEKINIVYHQIGEFMTSNGMSGISVTLLKITDDWLEALKSPAKTFAWINNS